MGGDVVEGYDVWVENCDFYIEEYDVDFEEYDVDFEKCDVCDDVEFVFVDGVEVDGVGWWVGEVEGVGGLFWGVGFNR